MIRRSIGAAVVAAAVLVLLASCAGPAGSPAPSETADVIVTFEVGDDERFKVQLVEPADIDIARRLLANQDAPGIPNGRVIRETGVNTGYSWSLDPNDIEFGDVTVEVCDGLPSDVEAGTISGGRYCPWSAEIVAIDPAP
jgi:hypothetical protein